MCTNDLESPADTTAQVPPRTYDFSSFGFRYQHLSDPGKEQP